MASRFCFSRYCLWSSAGRSLGHQTQSHITWPGLKVQWSVKMVLDLLKAGEWISSIADIGNPFKFSLKGGGKRAIEEFLHQGWGLLFTIIFFSVSYTRRMDPMVGHPLMDPTLIIHHAITCPNYRRAIPWTNSVQNISPNGMNRSSTSEPTTFVMSRRNYQLCLSTKDNLLWHFLGKTSITSVLHIC